MMALSIIVTSAPLQPIYHGISLCVCLSFRPFCFLISPFFMFRLYRCEECTEDILSEDENVWFCPRCEQWTPCPTPAIGNSTFQIEEPEYALYEFENQEDTYSRDNPSTSFNR